MFSNPYQDKRLQKRETGTPTQLHAPEAGAHYLMSSMQNTRGLKENMEFGHLTAPITLKDDLKTLDRQIPNRSKNKHMKEAAMSTQLPTPEAGELAEQCAMYKMPLRDV